MSGTAPFFVRSAMPADIAVIKNLLHESWQATYGPTYGEEKIRNISQLWHTQPRLLAQLDTPHSEFVVADDGTSIGGMGYAVMVGESDAHLKQLYVAPHLKGRGIGSQLLVETEGAFPQAKRVILEVEPENAQAIAFYESHGYSPYGRSEGDGGEFDMPALKMAKPLDGWDL